MHGFNNNNHSNFGADSDNIWFILSAGIAITGVFAFMKFNESSNRVHYDSLTARRIAGFLTVIINIFHAANDGVDIINEGRKIIVAGPHRTGLDGLTIASKVKGTPAQFFVTDAFNDIPGLSALLSMFKMIPIKAKGPNADALDKASDVLNQNGCIALFPQGNFSRLNEEPHRVYPGAAKLAVKHHLPIHVLRLDGFWSLQNPLIPVIIRNNTYYRAFFSFFHLNNIRTTLCCEIDFHLKDENQHLSDEDKIEEINAQMYAYFRETRELTADEIGGIKTLISDKKHHLIWNNKVKRDALQKELNLLKAEGLQLESDAAALSMKSA